jgi:hypothetical protein
LAARGGVDGRVAFAGSLQCTVFGEELEAIAQVVRAQAGPRIVQRRADERLLVCSAA